MKHLFQNIPKKTKEHLYENGVYKDGYYVLCNMFFVSA